MFDNIDWPGTIISTLALNAVLYLVDKRGRNSAYREMADKSQQDEINELKKKVNELSKFDELRKTLKNQNIINYQRKKAH